MEPDYAHGPAMLGRLFVSLLMGMILSLLYMRLHREDQTKSSFLRTLILLPLAASAVSLVIGNNIARAFGLLGAVALVRFRTVIKNTLDMVFVFIAITLGMASGTSLFGLGAASLILFAASLGIMEAVRYGTREHRAESYLVSVKATDVKRANEILEARLSDMVLTSHLDKVEREDHTSELRYMMVLSQGASERDLLERVTGIDDPAILRVRIKKR
jgi:hypothetical protein